jgi:metal-responsive CopG/Arc/MetJ family transcriptional regulator
MVTNVEQNGPVDYASVTLPRFLLLRVDEIYHEHGFTSRADFVKTAIRREIERIQKQKKGTA